MHEFDQTNQGSGATLTNEEALAWLRGHRSLLNLTAIARRIGCDPSTFSRAVSAKSDSEGYAVRLPEECLPALTALIGNLRAR